MLIISCKSRASLNRNWNGWNQRFPTVSARQELRGDISKRWQHHFCGINILDATVFRLGRAWAKNGSSSDNPSVYKYGQADGSSIHRPWDESSWITMRRQGGWSISSINQASVCLWCAIWVSFMSAWIVLARAECRHLNTCFHFTVLNILAY